MLNDQPFVQPAQGMTEQNASGGRVFDSMAQASKLMAIPIDVMKAMKRAGCPGFIASRVHEAKVVAWLDENPEALTGKEGEGTETLESLKKELMRQQIKRAREAVVAAELDNARRRGEYVSRAALEFAIPKVLAHAISVQRKHLPTDIFNTVCKETKSGFERILTEATKENQDDKAIE